MLLWRIWARVVRQFDDRATAERWRAVVFRRWLALSALALLAATWKLWTPQEVYPQVPLLSGWAGLPAAGAWIAGASVAGSLSVVLLSSQQGKLCRIALIVFATSVVLLFCGDQHRLQPWAYQFVVLAIVLAAVEPWRALVLARMLTVSIYFYSALSKLDQTFLTSTGAQFRDTLLGWFGMNTESPAVALLFPLGELAVALLLVFRPTRTLGLFSSLAMHLLTIAVLSPVGLSHSWGVLLWNAYFLGQNIILFWPPLHKPSEQDATAINDEVRPGEQRPKTTGAFAFSVLAQTLLAAVLLWPLLEPFGLCDNWIAWGLYAPRAERVDVLIDADDAERLPPGCREFIEESDAGKGWRQLRLDEWSLATLGAPVYPANRFELGVALAVAESTDLRGQFHVLAYGRASRFTGRRQFREYWGATELRRAANRYWLGMLPRENLPPDYRE